MSTSSERARMPSIRDVARLAGVSHQTVSRVLNDHPSIRPETKAKVLDAIAVLDYRPNLAARALVTSKSNMLGILSATIGEFGPTSSIAGIEDAAREEGTPSPRSISPRPRRRRSATPCASSSASRSTASWCSRRRCASSMSCAA